MSLEDFKGVLSSGVIDVLNSFLTYKEAVLFSIVMEKKTFKPKTVSFLEHMLVGEQIMLNFSNNDQSQEQEEKSVRIYRGRVQFKRSLVKGHTKDLHLTFVPSCKKSIVKLKKLYGETLIFPNLIGGLIVDTRLWFTRIEVVFSEELYLSVTNYQESRSLFLEAFRNGLKAERLYSRILSRVEDDSTFCPHENSYDYVSNRLVIRCKAVQKKETLFENFQAFYERNMNSKVN